MLSTLRLACVALAAVAFVRDVSAQSSSSSIVLPSGAPAGITPCILNCVTQAASSGGCSSFEDLSCVCTSSAFQSAARSCLQSNCTTAEQQSADVLQQQECAAASIASGGTSAASSVVSHYSSLSSALSSAASSYSSYLSSIYADPSGHAGSTSGSGSAASSPTSPAHSTGSTSTSASPTTSANAGVGFRAAGRVGNGGLAGAAVALLGVVAGAGLVL
ncbi:hypothetical protein AcW1_003930 [Taiwanofungus camphoratus]|nr:hypothetical protein AcV5_003878 [Antrodia cinnamomea]KAI0937893.1 hypothetical protein AcW1_003930 [Antrodia cinnamomea]